MNRDTIRAIDRARATITKALRDLRNTTYQPAQWPTVDAYKAHLWEALASLTRASAEADTLEIATTRAAAAAEPQELPYPTPDA